MFLINKLFSFKTLSFFSAASSLIALLFWYGAKPAQSLVTIESLSSSPDYFITKLHVKTFDNDGVLIETTNATQAFHYVNQSKTLLEAPNTKRRSKSGNWSAKGDKGVIEDGNNDILLIGNARATKKHLNFEDIILHANSVHYLDKNQSLITSGDATLVSIQGETSSNTITTFINSERIVMTGLVRGKYETAH